MLTKEKKILNGTSNFILAVDKRFFINNYGKWQGKSKLKFLKGNLISSPIAIYHKKFSTMTESFDKILFEIIESGFMHHFRNRFYGVGYEKWLNNMKRLQNSTQPLTNHQLIGLYTIFTVGLIVSVIVFIFELIFGKLVKK